MDVQYRPMTMNDYQAVVDLWMESEGIGLSHADSEEGIGRFLLRNPGLSFVAIESGDIIGAVICGHDGRRGFIHHLAVRKERRRQGIASQLVQCCLNGLKSVGIDKTHLYVFDTNQAARSFWGALDFYPRHELLMMSRDIERNSSAVESKLS
jgi:putative acetyltransferase